MTHMALVQALLPVFILILLGHGLRRVNFPDEHFWLGAERFTYYVLFPAMLVYKLGGARLPAEVYGQMAGIVFLLLGIMTVLLLLAQAVIRWAGPVYTSVYQGGIRFNSYVGLAAASLLYGDEGLSLIAVAAAIMIPLLNLLCILMFAVFADRGRVRVAPVLRAVATNPLILGSLGGMALGLAGTGFHPFVEGVIAPLSELALPLGLMTVGAGLQLKALRNASGPFLFASLMKLLVFPLLAFAAATWLGMDAQSVAVVVLLCALPTASSSYILARQLGGDGPLMAGIISGQTLLAMITMPLMLSLSH
ncbi:AEC family transporter [Marinobacteraceae bacterium S3BR75-40.1]